MKTTIVILAVCLGAALVNSLPIAKEGFQSKALDRLMVVEADNESALRSKRTIGLLRQLFPEVSKDVNPEANENNQVVSEADSQKREESQNNEVRVQFADETANSKVNEASEGELAPLEEIEANDDENRNKRFLNFGFGASGANSGGAGGSGGGSGNFLFDIIRQAADGAARAAGTVYRVVAGTQSLGLGLSASRDVGPASAPMMPAPAPGMMPAGMMPPPPGPPMMPGMMPPPGMNGTAMMPPLVAGSGSSTSDPAAGAPTPGPLTEAVPGPVTRLFVIANRGISNLIQDLILRLAATSERIVNFKARLITSII
ncbi:PREDICTED: formin-B isoform X1 [Ceratosolen solmsi marchali]|uniref:Formin-B isoform X1 n=1 Tax=Ceratosolen solmsi marchali TaxID=326594 RepID=A0AAJ6VJQ7_9HYME|nr:PREDICTED: formin-B isoform X1 [Ceratosolen solmsi marchali]